MKNTSHIFVMRLAIAFLASALVIDLPAQDLAKEKQALDLISSFAKDLCDSVKANGKAEVWDVSGVAKAQLNGVVTKIANLGVGAAAKYTSSEYQGVLQSDLGKVLGNQTDCRLSVFKDLKDRLLPSASAPIRGEAMPTTDGVAAFTHIEHLAIEPASS
jgi:hypothetical protein